MPAVALEVADRQRHEVRGHLRRGLELDGVLAGGRARRVGDDRAVRDRVVAVVDDRGQRERRLEGRLVERREHPARVGRFELGDRVAPVVGLAQIQAAQIVVQDAVVADVDLGVAGGNRPRERGTSPAPSAASSDTSAVCVWPPAAIDTAVNLISAAFSTMAADGLARRDPDGLRRR